MTSAATKAQSLHISRKPLEKVDMTHRKTRSTTDKFAIFSFSALFVMMGVRFSLSPEPQALVDVPETGALIESRLPVQQSVPLAQVLATQVQIERLMAAGMIENNGLDQAFDLLEQSSYSVDEFVLEKGMMNAEAASLKMIRPEADAELYDQYKAMSSLVEQYQAK